MCSKHFLTTVVTHSSSELQQEAAKEASRYIRHSGRSTPSAPPNPKDMAIHEVIKDYYAQIEQLADEKLVLAQRVIDLISRARARLDHDLSRVLLQQGEDPTVATISAASTVSVSRRSTVQELKETLRTPRETTPVVSMVPAPAQVAGNKSKIFRQGFLMLVLNPHRETSCWRHYNRFHRLWQSRTFHGVYWIRNSAVYASRCFRL